MGGSQKGDNMQATNITN